MTDTAGATPAATKAWIDCFVRPVFFGVLLFLMIPSGITLLVAVLWW
jgi:hypothetical protein